MCVYSIAHGYTHMTVRAYSVRSFAKNTRKLVIVSVCYDVSVGTYWKPRFLVNKY